MLYYHSRTWFGTEAFTYYNSHTSQHAEGFGVAMTLPIRFQVIVLDHIAVFYSHKPFLENPGSPQDLGNVEGF
jgi:hypothetical protein